MKGNARGKAYLVEVVKQGAVFIQDFLFEGGDGGGGGGRGSRRCGGGVGHLDIGVR